MSTIPENWRISFPVKGESEDAFGKQINLGSGLETLSF